MLDGADEAARLVEALVGPRVEPGEAASEPLDLELPALEIDPVDVGDLQLAARTGGKARGDVEHLIVVEIEAGDCPVRLAIVRLFLDRAGGARRGVKGDHAIAFGILHRISEYCRALGPGGGIGQPG